MQAYYSKFDWGKVKQAAYIVLADNLQSVATSISV